MFLQRPNILEKLDAWKQRSVPDGLLTDVYDGKIWKEFDDQQCFLVKLHTGLC